MDLSLRSAKKAVLAHLHGTFVQSTIHLIDI